MEQMPRKEKLHINREDFLALRHNLLSGEFPDIKEKRDEITRFLHFYGYSADLKDIDELSIHVYKSPFEDFRKKLEEIARAN